MKTSILIILLIANQVFAQSTQETELKTSISNVTVYLSGAQVTRYGEVNIGSGRLSKNSVRIKAF